MDIQQIDVGDEIIEPSISYEDNSLPEIDEQKNP